MKKQGDQKEQNKFKLSEIINRIPLKAYIVTIAIETAIIAIVTILLIIVSLKVEFLEKKEESTESLNHNHIYGEWEIKKQATCIEEGTKERFCACGKIQYETIEFSEHSPITIAAVNKTCTKNGYTSGTKCSVCDKIIIEPEIIFASHDYDDGRIVKNSTCKENGFKVYYCINCTDYYEETLEYAEHNYVEATCKTPETCTICGATNGSTINHNYNSSGTCSMCSSQLKFNVKLPSTPINIDYGYYNTARRGKITSISVSMSNYNASSNTATCIIKFYGTKTRDDGYSDSGVPVAWSLLNSKGTVISGTTTYSSSVREGQSFEITISVSGISLNQSYTLTAKSPSGY